MVERIGVFICDCGTNISDIVDTTALKEFAGRHKDVAEVIIHKLWCSEQGRQEMKRLILEKGFSRIVVAACSPKQHELTFQKVLESAGLNPYLMQMTNLREQIAWVTTDKKAATEKAKGQLNAALLRVKHQQPLEKTEIECKSDFLVLGAGITGMSAALTLAQKNRKVYLVEKEPWIGGKVVAYEDVFPNLECAPCMLEPKEDDVLHNEKIVLLTNSEIENVKGYFGNFEVQIRQKARFINADKCLNCGACFESCPVQVKNKFNGNLSQRHAIYAAFTGVLPNVPVIDPNHCLRFQGKDCQLCAQSCPMGAIDYAQQDRIVNVEVGAMIVASGFDLLDAGQIKNFSGGLSNVVDAFQFERLISTTGPSEGKIVTADNVPPRSIAFVHCAGSRDKNYKEYCSGVCCAYTLKLAHLARKKLNNEVKTYEFYSDWCLPGKGYQEFYNKMSSEGTEFIRVANPNSLNISAKEKQLNIEFEGKSVLVDLVVLATAMVPSAQQQKLAALLELSVDKDGFFASEHDKISPASTMSKGIYIAGSCAGPKDITQSVLGGQAAAGMALNRIVPGEKLELEPATAKVDEKLCGGCRICIALCPYQAINYDSEKKTAVVNEILCMGCGVCGAGCPSGAIQNKHFTVEQIFSEIEGVLDE